MHACIAHKAEIVVCHRFISMYSVIIKMNYLDNKCVSNKLIMMAAGAGTVHRSISARFGVRACVRVKYSHEHTVFHAKSIT